MYILPSTKALVAASIKNIGMPLTIRHMRNLGIDFVDCYVMLFGKLPRGM